MRQVPATATSTATRQDDDVPVRPMRADAVKNRRRILDAAEEVFAAEGLSVPIDAVAERACVGVGTLYRHFPTKEALFEAIMITRLEGLVETAKRAAGTDDAGTAFFSFLRSFAGQASMKHDMFDALAGAGIDIKSRCAGTFDELQAALKDLLARASAAGAVRDDVTTGEVIGLVVGACHAAERSGLGAMPDRMIDVVCEGLRRHA